MEQKSTEWEVTLGKVALALLPVSQVLGGAAGSRPASVCPPGLLDSLSPHVVLGGRAACSLLSPSGRRTRPGPQRGPRLLTFSGTDLNGSLPALHSHERCRRGHEGAQSHVPWGSTSQLSPPFRRLALPALPASAQMAGVTVSGH